ncbi:MAG: hypothetical protein GXO58_03065 [Thermodesulfobacteria bacterium]|nr:hypothetical protein [Thermodesulfobacteriota bacterium]
MSSHVSASRIKNIFCSDIPASAAFAILFIWTASFADYFLTTFQICHGGLELNPVLAPYFHNFEYEKALLVKTALTFPGICVLSVFYRHPVAIRAMGVIVVVYVCLLVYHALNILL